MEYEKFKEDYISFNEWYTKVDEDTFKYLEDEIEHPFGSDRVNSPSHYTSGKVEAIDVIEDAITEAPNVQAGFLQGQVLKYLLRLWHKIDAKEDAEKARWYLDRLIKSLE